MHNDLDLIDADGFYELMKSAAGAGTAIILNVGVQRLFDQETSLMVRVLVAGGVGMAGGILFYSRAPSFAAGFAGTLVGLAFLALISASASGTPLASVQRVASLEPRDVVEVEGEYVN